MSSITPNQLKLRLEALAAQAYGLSLWCTKFSPTVKGPVHAAHLAGIIKYEILENHALVAQGAEGEDSVLTESLRAILSDESAKTELIELFTSVAESAVEHELGRASARVNEVAQEMRSACEESQKELVSLTTQAVLLTEAAGPEGAPTPTIVGVDGKSESVARKDWKRSRVSVRKAWVAQKVAQEKAAEKLQQLSSDYRSDGELLTEDEKSEIRKSQKDSENLAKHWRTSIYSPFHCNGEEVETCSDEYYAFPVPKSLKSGDYKAFCEKVKNWMQADATIKVYATILSDIVYMFNAVDGAECMHLRAPDKIENWVEPAETLQGDTYGVYAIAFANFKLLQASKWKKLYEEMYAQSSEEVRAWIDKYHIIGQSAKLPIKIEQDDGHNFVYALLSEHVNFTSEDQHLTYTGVMDMVKLFRSTKTTSEAIDAIRIRLSKAHKLGINVPWSRCGEFVILALGSLKGTERNEVYNALVGADLQAPKILAHPKFNRDNCADILQLALEKTAVEIQRRMILDGQMGSGTRDYHEAGAEISALFTDTKMSEMPQHVRQSAQEACEEHGLSDKAQANKLANYVKSTMSPKLSEKEQDLIIHACTLTLKNGQSLAEPKLRESIKNLQRQNRFKNVNPYSKGGKSGKDGKGGKGGKGGKSGSGKGGRGDQQLIGKETCDVSGCNTKVPQPRHGSKFWPTACQDHYDKIKSGQTFQTDDGRKLTSDNPHGKQAVQARVTGVKKKRGDDDDDSSESKRKVYITSTDGGERMVEVDARTVEILGAAMKSDSLVSTEASQKFAESVALFSSR